MGKGSFQSFQIEIRPQGQSRCPLHNEASMGDSGSCAVRSAPMLSPDFAGHSALELFSEGDELAHSLRIREHSPEFIDIEVCLALKYCP
jgi:hypothetical protein